MLRTKFSIKKVLLSFLLGHTERLLQRSENVQDQILYKKGSIPLVDMRYCALVSLLQNVQEDLFFPSCAETEEHTVDHYVVLPDFFFENPYFLNLLSALCTDLYIFFPCVRIFSLVDIRPLFLELLLPKVPIVLKNALKKSCIKLNFLEKTQ